MSDLSIERAKAQFSATMEWLGRITAEKIKTKAGRDDIRRTFGCRIEGFEHEETDGRVDLSAGSLFDSPMT